MNFTSPPLQSSRLCHVESGSARSSQDALLSDDDERSGGAQSVVTHIIPKPPPASQFGCQLGSPFPALSPYVTRTKLSAGPLQIRSSISLSSEGVASSCTAAAAGCSMMPDFKMLLLLLLPVDSSSTPLASATYYGLAPSVRRPVPARTADAPARGTARARARARSEQ